MASKICWDVLKVKRRYLKKLFVANMLWDNMIEREGSESTPNSRLNALKRRMSPIYWSKPRVASDTSANGFPRNDVIATPNAHDKEIRIKKREYFIWLFGQVLWTVGTKQDL